MSVYPAVAVARAAHPGQVKTRLDVLTDALDAGQSATWRICIRSVGNVGSGIVAPAALTPVIGRSCRERAT